MEATRAMKARTPANYRASQKKPPALAVVIASTLAVALIVVARYNSAISGHSVRKYLLEQARLSTSIYLSAADSPDKHLGPIGKSVLSDQLQKIEFIQISQSTTSEKVPIAGKIAFHLHRPNGCTTIRIGESLLQVSGLPHQNDDEQICAIIGGKDFWEYAVRLHKKVPDG